MRRTPLFYKGLLALLAATALLVACSQGSQSILNTTFKGLNAERHCVDTNKSQRCYYLVQPPKADTRPKTLLIALHPAFHSVAQLESIANIVRPIAFANIVAIYPEGIGKQWNDGRHAEASKTFNDNTDDVGFLKRIIEKEAARFSIKKSHTTIAGMSNGAMMAMRMICETDVAGRIVSAVGNLPKNIAKTCHRSNIEQVTLVFGTDDDIVPYRGGKLGQTDTDWGSVISAQATETHIASLLGCSGAYQQYRIDADASDGTIAHKRDFNCAEKKMTSYHVQGMGHTWPGEIGLGAILAGRGTISNELNGNQLVIDAALSR